MTWESVSVTDVIVNRSKPSLAGRIPSESQWCGDEEQQTDNRSRETMAREFRAGVTLDAAGAPEPTSLLHQDSGQNTGKGVNLSQDRPITRTTARDMRERHW
jgi:hypothetical protein